MKYSMKKVLHFTTSLLLVLFLAACSTELPESEEIEVTPATQEEQEPPMTIKAIAVKDGMNNSSIAKAEYKTISLPNKLTVPKGDSQ